MKIKRTFLLSDKELGDLQDVPKHFPSKDAEVSGARPQKTGQVDDAHRDTKRYNIEWNHFNPEVLKKFTDFIGEDDLVANQTDYLEYGVGQFFKPHQDSNHHNTIREDLTGRVWSSSTLIKQTDDLEGGELLIYGPHINNLKSHLKPFRINLEVGETVFFPSNYWHEVTPVTKGVRTALVVWVGKSPKEIMKTNERVHAIDRGATFL